MKKVTPVVKLISNTPHPERVVATAAKLCYSPDSAIGLIENMTDKDANGFLDRLPGSHGTPFEMATFTFSIEGVSRAFSHELVRHRMASHNQRSQRYVTEEDFGYVVPVEIDGNEYPTNLMTSYSEEGDVEEYLTIQKLFETTMYRLAWDYKLLVDALIAQGLDEKTAIENARYVLPNACETKNIVTMNVRELHHFFNQRCCFRSLPEMREVANQMLIICKNASPVLFKDAGPFCVSDKCPEGNMGCGKTEDVRDYYKNISNLVDAKCKHAK